MTPRYVRRLLIALLFGCVATIAVADSAPTSQPKAIDDAMLAAIDAKAAGIRNLSADFVQEKYSPLLRDPIVTRGTIRAADGASLWVSAEPQPTRTRVDTARLQIYYVDRNTVEDYPIAGKLGSLAASPLPRLPALRERFTITADAGDGIELPADVANPVVLRLEPKEDDVRQYIAQVRVVLDADRGLVRAFELTDPDDERTLIRFSNVKTNADLPPDALQINAPADARLVRPLG